MHDDHVLESRNNVTLLQNPFPFSRTDSIVPYSARYFFFTFRACFKNRKTLKIVSTCDLHKSETVNGPFLAICN